MLRVEIPWDKWVGLTLTRLAPSQRCHKTLNDWAAQAGAAMGAGTSDWEGNTDRPVEYTPWYHPGKPVVPWRWVLVATPIARGRTEAE